MSLQISVTGLTRCMMRGIKVAAFRRGNGNKKPSLVAVSYPPKIHCSGAILPRLYFLLENKLSSVSIICPGPPIWTGLFNYWTGLVNYGMLAPARFSIHAGRLPLTLPLTFQYSCTTDRWGHNCNCEAVIAITANVISQKSCRAWC